MVFGLDSPAQLRLRAEEREIIEAYGLRFHAFRLLGSRHVRIDRPNGRNLIEDARPVLQVVELRLGHAGFRQD